MKKAICIVVMVMGFISMVSAQSLIEETKKISRDEVPVTVLKSYEANFGAVADANGSWLVVFSKYNEPIHSGLASKEVFKPIEYIYKGKDNKSEAHFNVDGKLTSSKGMEPITHTEE